MLFLDVAGERDEQAMLLKAIEEKRFTLRQLNRVSSDFRLIAGTVRDPPAGMAEGTFPRRPVRACALTSGPSNYRPASAVKILSQT